MNDRAKDPVSKEGLLAPFHGEQPAAPQWFENVVNDIPESNHVYVEGAKIHYLRWGDRARPGLLLVHGNAAHAYWWSFIAPFLARDYNVAAMDLSGMGDSDWRASYSMDMFVREQLAGDVLYPGNAEALVGTGFVVAGPWDFEAHNELREGTIDKEKTRLSDRDDMLVLPPGAFYPYHYRDKTFYLSGDMRAALQRDNPWAFCAHHWKHSWA